MENLAIAREVSETGTPDTDIAEQGNQTPESYVQRKSGPISSPLPTELVQQLVVMRRNPSEFTFLAMSRCKLCYKKCAVDIGHPLAATAGTWCPVHGWLYFASNTIRPVGEEYLPSKKRRVKVL